MKLTTSQLRQIIREEVSRVIERREDSNPDDERVFCARCGQKVDKDEARRDPKSGRNVCSSKEECDKLKKMFSEAREPATSGDDAALELLTHAFTMTVTLEDIPYIRFKKTPRGFALQDVEQQLGNMDTSVSLNDMRSFNVRPEDLESFLASNGARKMTPVRRRPMGPMGGYD